MDGVVTTKVIYDQSERGGQGDCRALQIDNRRVTFAKGKQIHNSPYILDTVIGSVGEARGMFRKARLMKGGEIDDEANKDKPSGVFTSGMDDKKSSYMNIRTPVDDGNPDVTILNAESSVKRVYGSNHSDSRLYGEGIKSVMRIECWFWDKTEDAQGELVYPYGRVVTVGVGSDGSGAVAGKTPELRVLADRPNPYKLLAERKGVFPIFQAQCHKVGREWGLSEVFHRIDPQKLINDVVNLTHDNWKATNSAPTLGLTRSGLTAENWTTEPNAFIELNGDISDVRAVVARLEPTSIAHVSLPFLQAYLGLSEQVGGSADVSAGRQPTGITAMGAIQALQNRAKCKFATIGRNINTMFVQVYYAIACCCQDFDSEYDAEYNQSKMTLINDEYDPRDPNTRYLPYDPRQTRGIAFRTEPTHQLSLQDVYQIMSSVAELDKNGIPGMGGIVLSYADDPSLKYEYERIIQEAEAKAQATMQAQQEAEAAAQRREIGGRITEKVVDAVSQSSKPQNERENSNGKAKNSKAKNG